MKLCKKKTVIINQHVFDLPSFVRSFLVAALHAFQWPHKLIQCQTDSSNTKSGKLQKLRGGHKILIFRGEELSYEGEVRKFSFSGGSCPIRGGDNFLGGG